MSNADRAIGLLKNIAILLESQHRPFVDHDGNWWVGDPCVCLPIDDVKRLYEIIGCEPPRHPKPKGSCETCRFAESGHERGYRKPCVDCKRPEMSNFQPNHRSRAKRALVRLANGR